MKQICLTFLLCAFVSVLAAQDALCESIRTKQETMLFQEIDSVLQSIDHSSYQQGSGFNAVIDEFTTWFEGHYCIETVEHDYLLSVDLADPAIFTMNVIGYEKFDFNEFQLNFEIRTDRLHFHSVRW